MNMNADEVKQEKMLLNALENHCMKAFTPPIYKSLLERMRVICEQKLICQKDDQLPHYQ